jgi:hypothetical protein
VTISLRNGCRYCTYGHAYALELHYLRQHDRLFPVGAEEVAEWAGRSRTELRTLLADGLTRADLHVELLLVDRVLDLAHGGQRPIDRAEHRLAHLISMFATLNEVGSTSGAAPDGAHDPVHKDEGLRARNAELRAAAT